MKEILQKLKTLLYDNYKLSRKLDEQAILLAQTLIRDQKGIEEKIKQDISKAEFKVFSQWGDDGIIQFLVNYLEIEPKTFVEFGVQNYRESNTRFLLMNNNWSGFIMDGSESQIDFIKKDWYHWMYDLQVKKAFITRENINQLLKDQGFEGALGILSIDIDGNDYWVWEAIEVVDPVMVIMEYNSVFGTERKISTPYNPEFVRTKAHHSNLYFGASLPALSQLAEKKGYGLVGSNSHGNNAFFIKKGKEKDLRFLSAQEAYRESKFRESRDPGGNFSFLRGDDRMEHLKGMEVINTDSGEKEKL